MNQESIIVAYEKMLSKPLSVDECAEARDSLVGFFALLMEIDQELHHSNLEHEL